MENTSCFSTEITVTEGYLKRTKGSERARRHRSREENNVQLNFCFYTHSEDRHLSDCDYFEDDIFEECLLESHACEEDLANWKCGRFCRPSSRSKRQNARNCRLVGTRKEEKELKRCNNVKLNWAKQKANIEEDLSKKRSERFGFDIYSRRSLTTSTSQEKQKVSSFGRDIAHHPRTTKYELRRNNVPKGQDFLLNIIDLQHRELAPEDYELLLLLDHTVDPKTTSVAILNTLLVTIAADVEGLLSEQCAVCMECYKAEESVKTLPSCRHSFHAGCIDQWLSSSSQNCPLDGLPVTTVTSPS